MSSYDTVIMGFSTYMPVLNKIRTDINKAKATFKGHRPLNNPATSAGHLEVYSKSVV
jgi:hypothetical protein